MQNTATPPTIALRRGIETSLIVLVITAALLVLPSLSDTLQKCSTLPAGTPCAVNWAGFAYAFIAAILSGLANALTAFLTSLHNQAQTPQPVVATTPDGATAVGATIPTEAK